MKLFAWSSKLIKMAADEEYYRLQSLRYKKKADKIEAKINEIKKEMKK